MPWSPVRWASPRWDSAPFRHMLIRGHRRYPASRYPTWVHRPDNRRSSHSSHRRDSWANCHSSHRRDSWASYPSCRRPDSGTSRGNGFVDADRHGGHADWSHRCVFNGQGSPGARRRTCIGCIAARRPRVGLTTSVTTVSLTSRCCSVTAPTIARRRTVVDDPGSRVDAAGHAGVVRPEHHAVAVISPARRAATATSLPACGRRAAHPSGRRPCRAGAPRPAARER